MKNHTENQEASYIIHLKNDQKTLHSRVFTFLYP